MTVLVIASMALSLTVSVALIAAPSGMRILLASLILRASTVSSWVLGVFMIIIGNVIAISKEYEFFVIVRFLGLVGLLFEI